MKRAFNHSVCALALAVAILATAAGAVQAAGHWEPYTAQELIWNSVTKYFEYQDRDPGPSLKQTFTYTDWGASGQGQPGTACYRNWELTGTQIRTYVYIDKVLVGVDPSRMVIGQDEIVGTSTRKVVQAVGWVPRGSHQERQAIAERWEATKKIAYATAGEKEILSGTETRWYTYETWDPAANAVVTKSVPYQVDLTKFEPNQIQYQVTDPSKPWKRVTYYTDWYTVNDQHWEDLASVWETKNVFAFRMYQTLQPAYVYQEVRREIPYEVPKYYWVDHSLPFNYPAGYTLHPQSVEYELPRFQSVTKQLAYTTYERELREVTNYRWVEDPAPVDVSGQQSIPWVQVAARPSVQDLPYEQDVSLQRASLSRLDVLQKELSSWEEGPQNKFPLLDFRPYVQTDLWLPRDEAYYDARRLWNTWEQGSQELSWILDPSGQRSLFPYDGLLFGNQNQGEYAQPGSSWQTRVSGLLDQDSHEWLDPGLRAEVSAAESLQRYASLGPPSDVQAYGDAANDPSASEAPSAKDGAWPGASGSGAPDGHKDTPEDSEDADSAEKDDAEADSDEDRPASAWYGWGNLAGAIWGSVRDTALETLSNVAEARSFLRDDLPPSVVAAIDGIEWVAERTHQGVLNAGASGARAFEDALHDDPNASFASALLGSLPALAGGFAEGLTGQAEDRSGSDLVEGFAELHGGGWLWNGAEWVLAAAIDQADVPVNYTRYAKAPQLFGAGATMLSAVAKDSKLAGAADDAAAAVRRWGRLGGPEHREAVVKEAAKYKAEGHNILAGGGGRERRVSIEGGTKAYRYPDIITQSPAGEIKYVNIGKNIKREREAVKDLKRTGKDVELVPF